MSIFKYTLLGFVFLIFSTVTKAQQALSNNCTISYVGYFLHPNKVKNESDSLIIHKKIYRSGDNVRMELVQGNVSQTVIHSENQSFFYIKSDSAREQKNYKLSTSQWLAKYENPVFLQKWRRKKAIYLGYSCYRLEGKLANSDASIVMYYLNASKIDNLPSNMLHALNTKPTILKYEIQYPDGSVEALHTTHINLFPLNKDLFSIAD